MKRALVTGGTGFIGQALCPRLRATGHELTVLTRQSRPGLPQGVTRAVNRLEDVDPSSVDAVINLAGEPIADARWTPARKQLLERSRIALTEELLAWIGRSKTRPRLLLSASAVGFYGDQGGRVLDEQSAPHVEYQHTLCRRWEEAALGADDEADAKPHRAQPQRLGLGGPIGHGRQWMSWIHRDDVIGLIGWLLAREDASGVYNATAPEPVDSRGFARTLGTVLHRPAVLPLPGPVLRLALGEMSCLLLGGQRVLPARALAEGYRFRYPSLEAALREATTSIA